MPDIVHNMEMQEDLYYDTGINDNMGQEEGHMNTVLQTIGPRTRDRTRGRRRTWFMTRGHCRTWLMTIIHRVSIYI